MSVFDFYPFVNQWLTIYLELKSSAFPIPGNGTKVNIAPSNQVLES
ncbi:Uncharacterised protein [Escherichia coli]|nr:Uncharacterised protein [Escherichia coli]